MKKNNLFLILVFPAFFPFDESKAGKAPYEEICPKTTDKRKLLRCLVEKCSQFFCANFLNPEVINPNRIQKPKFTAAFYCEFEKELEGRKPVSNIRNLIKTKLTEANKENEEIEAAIKASKKHFELLEIIKNNLDSYFENIISSEKEKIQLLRKKRNKAEKKKTPKK
jgi:cysteinyl-tRNA synthetase